ncbi:MAG TPA: hypothetical protein VE226_06920 [Nitrososphaeraceae archaeon]|nr:hypothetical protein [Nitrososphaeraceae archaeon]
MSNLNSISMAFDRHIGFNKDSAAFVIIEYKKDRNFSVVYQGVAYLYLMLYRIFANKTLNNY